MRRPQSPLVWLVGALALLAAACSSSDEVVFESTTPTTVAVQESAPAESTSTTTTTPPNTSAPTTTNPPAPPPTTPLVDHSGPAVALPGNLAISLFPSTITALGIDAAPLIETSEEGVFLAQPNWSPDGEFVAWARGVDGESGSVVVGSILEGSVDEYATPFIPFYIQWRPDSSVIALLGGVNGGETGLITVDLETGEVTDHHSSRSFYLAWSPDGASMITHLDQTQLELYDVGVQTITSVGTSTGRFEAAQWMPDGSAFIYARTSTAQTASGGGVKGAQSVSIDELVRQDASTARVEVLARAPGISSFSIAPDGSRIAYNSSTLVDTGLLNILDLETLDAQAFEVGPVVPWQWSPDGRHILLMAFDTTDVTLTYRVWTDGDVVEYATSRPTASFLTRYLPFWGQYSRSHSLWAPDSSGFTFPALDGGIDLIFYQPLDETLPALVREGSMATFTPVGG